MKKLGGHSPRLVHVKINANTITFCPLDKVSQGGKPRLVAFSELGKMFPTWRELPQYDMQPNTVYAYIGQLGQQPFRKRICLVVQQWISKRCKIGIDESQTPFQPFGVDWFAYFVGVDFRQLLDKMEPCFTRLCQLISEMLLQELFDLGCSPARFCSRRNVAQYCALWLETAKLDKEKVIFMQRESKFLRR